jgi:protein pelota
MRILKKRINSKGIGFLHLIPTEEDDFWHLYNLIQIGDLVKTSTYRKLVREGINDLKTSIF